MTGGVNTVLISSLDAMEMVPHLVHHQILSNAMEDIENFGIVKRPTIIVHDNKVINRLIAAENDRK